MGSAGVILESMSTRKLTYVMLGLTGVWLASLLAGAFISPPPNSSMQFLATKCIDEKADIHSQKWFFPRGKGQCRSIDDFASKETQAMGLTAENIVFAVQMPHNREGQALAYTRWQQVLMGVMMLDIEYQPDYDQDVRVHLLMKARLAYRDDPTDDWRLLDEAFVHRNLDCDIEVKREGYYYNCTALSLFELGSLHHKSYLLNLRLPSIYDAETGARVGVEHNKLGKLVDLHVAAIHQNGGFTRVWVSLKTFFFPAVLIEVIWFWRRIGQLPRSSTLLERMLLALGCSLTLINIPLEYLTLSFDMPWLTLANDVKQGVFYATLMAFWLVFTGEHGINETGETGEKVGLRAYWKNLAVVVFGCLCLFLFDLCERGLQLKSAFDSVWATDLGTNLSLACIILAGLSAGVYFLYLCYRIYRVMITLRQRQSAISAMSSVRRLHYEGVVWRFNFLVVATLITAAVTAIGFILGRVAEGTYKWDEEITLDASATLMIGVYSLWNCYIFALVFLYAPSHKNWPSSSIPKDGDGVSQNGEEIEFSVHGGHGPDGGASEISSLTEFMRHQAQD